MSLALCPTPRRSDERECRPIVFGPPHNPTYLPRKRGHLQGARGSPQRVFLPLIFECLVHSELPPPRPRLRTLAGIPGCRELLPRRTIASANDSPLFFVQIAAAESDAYNVDLFFENARRILETATAAQSPSEATIVITEAGGLRILSASDWPLDRLVAHLGAQSAYRVTARTNGIEVEGRSRTRSCRLQEVRSPLRAGTSLLLPAA